MPQGKKGELTLHTFSDTTQLSWKFSLRGLPILIDHPRDLYIKTKSGQDFLLDLTLFFNMLCQLLDSDVIDKNIIRNFITYFDGKEVPTACDISSKFRDI